MFLFKSKKNESYFNKPITEDISDQELLEQVMNHTVSQNCESAAYGYITVVSHVLYFRSALDQELLKIVIRPIYYLGIDDPKEVIEFIKGFVNNKKLMKIYKPTKQSTKWINDQLKDKKQLIDIILNELKNE